MFLLVRPVIGSSYEDGSTILDMVWVVMTNMTDWNTVASALVFSLIGLYRIRGRNLYNQRTSIWEERDLPGTVECADKISSNIRHAEKSRKSSCKFADRIARISIADFEKRKPRDSNGTALKYRQTVLASIVAVYRNEDGALSMKVVAFGVGTKFLKTAMIMHDRKNQRLRVHDCHAEVLVHI